MWRGEPDSNGSTWEFNLLSLVKITKLKIGKHKQRRRRGNEPLQKNEAHTQFVDGIGSGIAKALKWNSNVMDRIAHPDNKTHHDDPDGFSITIVLADKRGLGVVRLSRRLPQS